MDYAMDLEELGVRSTPNRDAFVEALADEILRAPGSARVEECVLEIGDASALLGRLETGWAASRVNTFGLDASLSIQSLGDDLSVTSSMDCPTCDTVQLVVPYTGGVVRGAPMRPPLDVTVRVPGRASRRGILLLFRNEEGSQVGIFGTSIPDGDFAAG